INIESKSKPHDFQQYFTQALKATLHSALPHNFLPDTSLPIANRGLVRSDKIGASTAHKSFHLANAMSWYLIYQSLMSGCPIPFYSPALSTAQQLISHTLRGQKIKTTAFLTPP
ncbi:hypothetical protein ACTXT7_009893, partial [Hymenolepis weldensis]